MRGAKPTPSQAFSLSLVSVTVLLPLCSETGIARVVYCVKLMVLRQ